MTWERLGFWTAGMILAAAAGGHDSRADELTIPQPAVNAPIQVAWPTQAQGPDGGTAKLLPANKDCVARFDGPRDWSGANSLQLLAKNERASHHEMEIVIEAPDAENSFVSPFFALNWSGQNAIQMDRINFRLEGKPDWSTVSAVQMRQTAPGYEATNLKISNLEASAGFSEAAFDEGLVFLDLTVVPRLSSREHWRSSGGLSSTQAWNALFWTIQPTAKDESRWIERRVSSPVAGFRSLEFTLTVPPGIRWRSAATFDSGSAHGSWNAGRGGDPDTVRLPIPPDASSIERLRIEFQNETPAAQVVGHWAIAKANREGPWISERFPVPETLRRSGASADAPDDTPTHEPAAYVEKLAKNPAWDEEKATILETADRFAKLALFDSASALLPHNWKGKPTTAGLLTDFTWSEALISLQAAYEITGEKRYAEALIDALLAASTVPHWEWRVLESVPVGFNGRAPFAKELGAEVAGAYQSVRDLMTQAQRDYVLAALRYRGLYPTSAFMRSASYIYGMNQGLVFANALGMAALPVVDEIPAAPALARQAEDAMLITLSNYILSDGGCAEGPAYFGYAMLMTPHLLAALAEQDAEGLKERLPEGFDHIFDYPHFTLSNSSLRGEVLSKYAVNVNNTRSLPGYMGLESLAAFMGKYFEDPEAFEWLEGKRPDFENVAFWPDLPEDVSHTSRALSHHFPKLDSITLRDGVDYGDTLIFQQNGTVGKGGHTHFDRGALLIEAYGEYLGLDPGQIEYTDTRAAQYHSTAFHPHTLTFAPEQDQVLHAPDGGPAARVLSYLSSPVVTFNSTDLTAAYPNLHHYVRDVIFIRPDLVLSFDWVRGEAETPIYYHANSQGKQTFSGSRLEAVADISRLTTHFNRDDFTVKSQGVYPTNFAASNHHLTLRADRIEKSPLIAVHDIALNQSAERAKVDFMESGLSISKGEERVEIQFSPPDSDAGAASYLVNVYRGGDLVAGGFINSSRGDFGISGDLSITAPEITSCLFAFDESRLVLVPETAMALEISLAAARNELLTSPAHVFLPGDSESHQALEIQVENDGFRLPETDRRAGDWVVLGESAEVASARRAPRVLSMKLGDLAAPLEENRGGWRPAEPVPGGDAVAVFSGGHSSAGESWSVLVSYNGKDVTDQAVIAQGPATDTLEVRVPANIVKKHFNPDTRFQTLRIRAFGDNAEQKNATAFFVFQLIPPAPVTAGETAAPGEESVFKKPTDEKPDNSLIPTSS